METLDRRECVPCEGGTSPLSRSRIDRLLPQVPGWSLRADDAAILRRFEFTGFSRTVSFVNAMAWIAHRQGHHPDFTAGAYHCTVTFTTHAIGGLSENDFICAARLNTLTEATP
jgi:4a-hydroxytetrahydrobiopterin dehydratase